MRERQRRRGAHLERQEHGRRLSPRTASTRSGSPRGTSPATPASCVDRTVEWSAPCARSLDQPSRCSSRRTSTAWPSDHAVVRARSTDDGHLDDPQRGRRRSSITRLTESALPAGTHELDVQRPHADGTMLPRGRVHLARDRDRRHADRDAGGTRSTPTPSASSRATRRPGAASRSPSRSRRPRRWRSARALYIYQPGVAAWSVRLTKTGTYTYKATLRLKSSGRAGTVSLKVKGRDTKGGSQSTTVTYRSTRSRR